MAKLLPIFATLMIAGLFAIALISGGIQLARVNNSNNSIANDPSLSKYASSLNESLATANEKATASEEAIAQSPSTLTTGGSTSLGLDATQGIWKNLKVVPLTIYNLTLGLLISKIFGGGAFWIIFSVIGSILTLAIIVAVIRFFTQGEGG